MHTNTIFNLENTQEINRGGVGWVSWERGLVGRVGDYMAYTQFKINELRVTLPSFKRTNEESSYSLNKSVVRSCGAIFVY